MHIDSPKHQTFSNRSKQLMLFSKCKLGDNDRTFYVMSGYIHLVESDPFSLLDNLPSDEEDNEEANVDV